MNKNKTGFYSVFISVLVLLIGVCGYFLYYFYNLSDNDVDTNALLIKENGSMSYNVNLLNEDFSTDTLNMAYVPTILDNIRGNYNYSVIFDKRVKGEYSYSVVGNLIAETKKGEKVLNREVFNQPLKKYEVDGNVINISDHFTLNYKLNYITYTNYLNNYGMNDLDARVEYKVYLHYTIYNESIKKHVMNTEELVLVAPLSDNIVNIKSPGDFTEQRKEYSDVTAAIKPIYLVIIGEFIGAILLCLLIIIYLIRKIVKSESLYEKKRRALLKKYDANIVHIKELPNLKKMEVMFVDNFKDLVDASNTLGLPIHYIDIVIGHEATFIILNKKTAYVYKLSDKDLRD